MNELPDTTSNNAAALGPVVSGIFWAIVAIIVLGIVIKIAVEVWADVAWRWEQWSTRRAIRRAKA